MYGRPLGQLINSDKKTKVFSKNNSRRLRWELMSLWNNGKNQQYEEYPSLTPYIKRVNLGAFSDIKNHMLQKL